LIVAVIVGVGQPGQRVGSGVLVRTAVTVAEVAGAGVPGVPVAAGTGAVGVPPT